MFAEKEARQNERLNAFPAQLGALNARFASVPLFSQASFEAQSDKYSLLDALLAAIGEQRAAIERTQSEWSEADNQCEWSAADNQS